MMIIKQKIKDLINSIPTVKPPYHERHTQFLIQKYEHILQRNNRSLKDYNNILEFGCGYGRLIKYILVINNTAMVYGCDTLSGAINYCQKKYKNKGTFYLNDCYPPISLEDEQFDLIYSYSVFTHLSEKNHIRWLQELARLLKPNGVMLHSVKSYMALRRIKLFSPEELLKYKISSITKYEADVPYHYIVDDPSTPEYGLTIINKDYIIKNWPDYSGLKIIDYQEGCVEAYPEGCHDLILLGKL